MVLRTYRRVTNSGLEFRNDFLERKLVLGLEKAGNANETSGKISLNCHPWRL